MGGAGHVIEHARLRCQQRTRADADQHKGLRVQRGMLSPQPVACFCGLRCGITDLRVIDAWHHQQAPDGQLFRQGFDAANGHAGGTDHLRLRTDVAQRKAIARQLQRLGRTSEIQRHHAGQG